jgi:hypothetical protein
MDDAIMRLYEMYSVVADEILLQTIRVSLDMDQAHRYAFDEWVWVCGEDE